MPWPFCLISEHPSLSENTSGLIHKLGHLSERSSFHPRKTTDRKHTHAHSHAHTHAHTHTHTNTHTLKCIKRYNLWSIEDFIEHFWIIRSLLCNLCSSSRNMANMFFTQSCTIQIRTTMLSWPFLLQVQISVSTLTELWILHPGNRSLTKKII